jgi:hypothetical protein
MPAKQRRKRKVTHVECPSCGCRVGARHRAPMHCKMRRRAFELRAEGITLDQIGREFGFSRQRVHQMLSTTPVQKKMFWSLALAHGKSNGLNEKEIRAQVKPGMNGTDFFQMVEAKRKK